MNRIKRRKQKKKFLILIIFVCITAFLLVFPAYAYMRQNLDIKGNTNILDLVTDSECSATVNYEIYTWSNNNTNYYRIVFTLTNNGNKDYNYWDVFFDVPSDTELATYSSVEASIIGTKVKASNVSYNGNILSGDSIAFEIQLTTNELNYIPNNITVNNCYAKMDEDNKPNVKDSIEVSFVVVGSYGNYTYQYDVFVKNISSTVINNWNFVLEKPTNTTLSNAWNANYVIKDDTIEISNMSYNGIIQPGESASFGLIIDTDILNYIPSLVE